MPLWKLIQRPLLPVRDTWQDAVPLVVLFVLLAVAAWGAFRLRGRNQTVLRRSVQILSTFIFVIFLHRCLCALRGWAFGLQLIGSNNLIAFGHLSVFVIIMAFTAWHGRLFCGWLCPLGLPQELLGRLAFLRRKHASPGTSLIAGYLLLGGLLLCLVWIGLAVRPATQFFSENVAAVWGAALLVTLFLVLLFEGRDRRFRALKYVSAAGWLGLSTVGVFVTNPWCVLMGNELDYSSLVGLLAVFAGGVVVASAWCRYACPMGAALALLARYSRFKIVNSKACTGCGECRGVCPTDAIMDGQVHQSSCLYCGACVGTCGFHWRDELARRREDGAEEVSVPCEA
jgi:polyferredoxin